LSQEKNAPPPAPVPVQEEKPKLVEPDVTAETSKLSEGDAKQDEKPKALAPEVTTPKTQADLGSDDSNNLNIGSEGLKK
jgi:ubiquinol-cytochrome c reductase cytochrome b subunit